MSTRRIKDAVVPADFVPLFLASPLIRISFWIFMIAFVGSGLAFLTVEHFWQDYWRHLSAVMTLSRNPFQPTPLYISTEWNTHLYTPYHLFWGVIARWFDLDVVFVSVLMGVANVILFIFACRCLAEKFLENRKLDVLIASALWFLWYLPPAHSSFYNFGYLLPASVSVFWFSFPLSLVLMCRFFEPGKRGLVWQILFSITIGIVTVSHLVTGSFLLIVLGIKIIIEKKSSNREKITGIIALLFSLIIVFLWPYCSVIDLLFVKAEKPVFFDYVKQQFYGNPFLIMGPAALGLFGFFHFTRDKKRDLLSVCFIVFLAIYGLNYWLEISAGFSRYIIFLTLFLQLLLVRSIVLAPNPFWRRAFWAGFSVILALSAWYQARFAVWIYHGLYQDLTSKSPLGWHSNSRNHAEIRAMDRLIATDETVMVEMSIAELVTFYTRGKVVIMRHLSAVDPRLGRREADTATFYAPETSDAARTAIMERYDARYLLLKRDDVERFRDFTSRWNRLFAGEKFVLYGRSKSPAKPAVTE